jgi:class 3 adenylate cyclase
MLRKQVSGRLDSLDSPSSPQGRSSRANSKKDLVTGLIRVVVPYRLGDGGMFLFPEATAAVRAALEMSEGAPAAGLPTTQIGIQSGPVVFQGGDVYGRTVNIASRIADLAEAGDVLTSEETMRQVETDDIEWTLIGPAKLKGVAAPVTLYGAAHPTRRTGRRERPST